MATKIKTPEYLKKIIKDYGEIIRSGTEVLAQRKRTTRLYRSVQQ